MIRHETMQVSRTAHVYTMGDLTANTRYIWMACHGYGQLAERFIYKFENLDPAEHFIIAPEGLSKFYWNGVQGSVVASWMTSRDRLSEIEDYLNYLYQVFNEYQSRFRHNVTYLFFGFSQGTATIMRFLARFQPQFGHIFLWSGSIPRDVDYGKMANYFQTGTLHLIYGNEDEYLTPELIQSEMEFIENQNLKITRHMFEGTHRVDKGVLVNYVKRLL